MVIGSPKLTEEERALLHELVHLWYGGPRRGWLRMLWVQVTGAA